MYDVNFLSNMAYRAYTYDKLNMKQDFNIHVKEV